MSEVHAAEKGSGNGRKFGARAFFGSLLLITALPEKAEGQQNSPIPNFSEARCVENTPMLPVDELEALAQGGFGRVQVLGATQPMNRLILLADNELQTIRARLNSCDPGSERIARYYRAIIEHIDLIVEARRTNQRSGSSNLTGLINGTPSNSTGGTLYARSGINVDAISNAYSDMRPQLENTYRDALARGLTPENAVRLVVETANAELRRLGLLNTQRRLAANY